MAANAPALLDVKLELNRPEPRDFKISGRLPSPLAEAMCKLVAEGNAPSEIWEGLTIDGLSPDHMLVVRDTTFESPDQIEFVARRAVALRSGPQRSEAT